MPTSATPGRILLIAAGGLLGSALRHLATRSSSGVPWQVLGVNLVGAVLAGFFVARVGTHAHRARVLLPFAVVGVAGALTTFSGLVVDTVVMMEAGAWFDAARYAGASVVMGPVAAFLGMWAGDRV